jgi:polar amino acid transport system ATP-binding protein
MRSKSDYHENIPPFGGTYFVGSSFCFNDNSFGVVGSVARKGRVVSPGVDVRDLLSIPEASVFVDAKRLLTVKDFVVAPGERVAIVGRSGSGKTTLLKLIAGLVVFEGSVSFRNMDGSLRSLAFTGRVDARLLRTIGFQLAYVPQHLGLWSHLDISDNITLPARRLTGLTGEEADHRCRRILTELGLIDKIHNRPSQLSGGEQQRIAIARASLCSPQLILLDEITSALDPTTTGEILSLLPKFFSKDATVIFVTHQYGFARQFATHVGFILEGRFITKVTTGMVDSGMGDPNLMQLVFDSKKFYSW